VEGGDWALYGTAYWGGDGPDNRGHGVVFRLEISGPLTTQ
jgi:uncharacterized repeat protein (TIGR03803 family)